MPHAKIASTRWLDRPTWAYRFFCEYACLVENLALPVPCRAGTCQPHAHMPPLATGLWHNLAELEHASHMLTCLLLPLASGTI